ncbi:tyrosine-type recombinase/integrase [Paenibacillus sp. J5C_2022]|uniref:tyrosine-type recombinase/integrase n=1 Tax=Paenibacillus sp. J5C2022 TaxID=2977129 RepID=UPI0021CED1A7|nr:tyrosine-type recombinase/integrase [Paenibacillus sp. J5C2022]MCU6709287.1 tyrosine-type recombinase/integrase [Paenibacillus sp. J5C2022]
MALPKRKRRIDMARKDYPELTLQQALDMVISVKKAEGLRERSLQDYTKDFGYFTKWLAEHHPDIQYVHELNAGIFRDHVAWMKYDAKRYGGHKYNNNRDHGTGLSDTTINIRLRVLKAVFNQLERDELIAENPVAAVKLIRQDVDLTNCLTDDEVKAILAQPDRRDFVGFRDYVGIVLLLDSGLRVSELLGLRVSDVDFKTRFIELPGDRSKNRKPRLVPISAHTAKLLLQLVTENRRHFTIDFVFLSVNGEPIGANHFNKRLKHHAEKAGVSAKKYTAHVYRHTWAKSMILNGCDPFTLQKLGGWSDIRTMRRYIQMDTKEMRDSHDSYSPVNTLVRGSTRI